jgi:hypothetical protein
VGAGHEIKNVDAWGSYVCVKCGTGRDYAVEPCTGKKQHPCPTMTNGHTRGTCMATFASSSAAEAHYAECHAATPHTAAV